MPGSIIVLPIVLMLDEVEAIVLNFRIRARTADLRVTEILDVREILVR